jgi:hypothetical protein
VEVIGRKKKSGETSGRRVEFCLVISVIGLRMAHTGKDDDDDD